MNITRLKLFFDSLIVFLNLSNSYSIIPYFLFFQYYRGVNTAIITILNIIYLLLRFGGRLALSPRDNLFYLFCIINLLNMLFGYLTDTMGVGMLPFIFANITFYFVLYNIFNSYMQLYCFHDSFKLIVRGYIWLCILCIVSVLSLYFLITVFNFNPLVNNVNGEIDLFSGNVERNSNVNYYFPLGISIIQKTLAIKIEFFQKYGVITGLYHEGHTITFLVIPSVFLVFLRFRGLYRRLPVISAYILVMLIVASTTNILSMLVCLLVFCAIMFKKEAVYSIAMSLVAYVVFCLLDSAYYQFVFDKIASRSAEYSMATLKFAFTPETFIGTNFYNLSYWDAQDSELNVGFVTFFLNILFLFLLVWKIARMNLAESLSARLVGLFVLYFFLHSMKINMFAYSLSYTIFVIFILHIYCDQKGGAGERVGKGVEVIRVTS